MFSYASRNSYFIFCKFYVERVKSSHSDYVIKVENLLSLSLYWIHSSRSTYDSILSKLAIMSVTPKQHPSTSSKYLTFKWRGKTQPHVPLFKKYMHRISSPSKYMYVFCCYIYGFKRGQIQVINESDLPWKKFIFLYVCS